VRCHEVEYFLRYLYTVDHKEEQNNYSPKIKMDEHYSRFQNKNQQHNDLLHQRKHSVVGIK
jgi:hypothetical protein